MGLDIDPAKVEALNAGRSYIKHISDQAISQQVKSGRFSASSDFSLVREVEAVIICVPTPLNKNREPDISYIIDTGKAIAPHLRKGTLVVLESTTYPGTTDEDLREVLEKGSGMKAGKDFHLAFSPEREDPGNPQSVVATIPKVVGGYTPACLEKAKALYVHALTTIVPVSSCRVAEATKILENTFRSVNIALVNELKVVYSAMGIDIWEVIDAAKTKPFGFMPFYPGPGLGGHCIPIDPFYLTWKAREYGQHTRFIELAGEINTAMPDYVVHRVADALNSQRKAIRGSRILIVGLAYKPNVDDERESPSYVLMDLLHKRGAKVAYYDPYVPVIRPTREHPHWAGTKSVRWNRKHHLRFRLGAHRHQPCLHQLPGTGRLGSPHRRHPQRHGQSRNQARPGLESVSPWKSTHGSHRRSNLKNAPLGPSLRQFRGKAPLFPVGYLRNRLFCARSTRKSQLFDCAHRVQKDVSVVVITRQLQHVATRPAGEFPGQHEKIAPDRFDRGSPIFLRQAEPLEPMHQVVGEQEHLKERHIGRPLLGGDFVEGQMIQKLSDGFLDVGSRVVGSPNILRFQIQVGDIGRVFESADLKQGQLIGLVGILFHGPSHHDEAMGLLPFLGLYWNSATPQPKCMGLKPAR